MVIHTDGAQTVSNFDWTSGGHEAFEAPARPAREEFRVAYSGGGHSMPMPRERAEAYVSTGVGKANGDWVESRTVTEWGRADRCAS